MTGEFAIAVHAVVYLNRHQTLVSSEVLAQNVCTNSARIRKVLSKLKRAGLIATKEGAVGGYHFVSDPKQVTLLDIFDALGEPMIAQTWRSGNPDMDCMIASGMASVMDALYGELDGCCRKHLSGVSIQDVDDRLFAEKQPPGTHTETN